MGVHWVGQREINLLLKKNVIWGFFFIRAQNSKIKIQKKGQILPPTFFLWVPMHFFFFEVITNL